MDSTAVLVSWSAMVLVWLCRICPLSITCLSLGVMRFFSFFSVILGIFRVICVLYFLFFFFFLFSSFATVLSSMGFSTCTIRAIMCLIN